jgi:hypothetical protein
VWPDDRVVTFVTENYIPARVHVKEQAEDFERFGDRFGAQWTPTLLMIDPSGVERHRVEGFLPTDELLAQLTLGLGRIAYYAKNFKEAERRFELVLERFPDTDGAPEAQYWAGVSRYKESHDAKDLAAIAAAFRMRYAGTVWAKKASVWDNS